MPPVGDAIGPVHTFRAIFAELFVVSWSSQTTVCDYRPNRGILGFKRGAILVSLCWVAILVNIIDRKWWQAAVWALISATFSAIGLIHVPVRHANSSPHFTNAPIMMHHCCTISKVRQTCISASLLPCNCIDGRVRKLHRHRERPVLPFGESLSGMRTSGNNYAVELYSVCTYVRVCIVFGTASGVSRAPSVPKRLSILEVSHILCTAIDSCKRPMQQRHMDSLPDLKCVLNSGNPCCRGPPFLSLSLCLRRMITIM